MDAIIILCLIAILTIVILIFRHIHMMNPATNLSTSIITTGAGLVAASFSGFREFVLAGVYEFFSKPYPKGLVEDDPLSIICGLALIIIGIYLQKDIKDRIFVLNMYGLYAQRDISDENAIRDLRLSDFKVKEIVLDFIDTFRIPMSTESNAIIIKKIDSICEKFSTRSIDRKSCFTGMAPIPYTIYAGTRLASSNVRRYFEYRRSDSQYYELSRKKTKKFDMLRVHYPDVSQPNATEVIIAISISNEIAASDLQQFDGLEHIDISIESPKNDAIKSISQLDNYCSTIVSAIENLKSKYPMLSRVYIAASVPSCLSLELGKNIALHGNRLQEIVSLHYKNTYTPKYPFGIIVSGEKQGDLVDFADGNG